jgi:hypothetical protein
MLSLYGYGILIASADDKVRVRGESPPQSAEGELY